MPKNDYLFSRKNTIISVRLGPEDLREIEKGSVLLLLLLLLFCNIVGAYSQVTIKV